MSSQSPTTPSCLTATQREDLTKLWAVQTRECLDVRLPSCLDNKLTMAQIANLHTFFLAILRQALPRNINGSLHPHLKSTSMTCLRPFLELFVASENDHRASVHGLRLRGGRRVISLPYDECMNEFNNFEFQGEADVETVRARSFGAYLHHFPLQALPAVNASMSLSVATLWRSLNELSSGTPTCSAEVPPAPSHLASPSEPDSASNQLARLHRFLDNCEIVVRFLHVQPTLPMGGIKTGLVGKFLSVKGHVVKARPKRLRVTSADFLCQKCGALISHSFEQGRFSVPTKCSGQTCRSRTFTIVQPTARYSNVQELKLQECQDDNASPAGRTPRQLDVVLQQDLMEACRPGDVVLLACYVDAVNSAVAAGRAGKRALETSTYKLFLQGHSIATLSETTSSSGSNSKSGGSNKQQAQKHVYTQQQTQNITQLCHADHKCFSLVERRAFPFDLLVRSLCPSIIGHHAVKAGILLCLLGGTPQPPSVDRGSTIRSNSHILIVGDPGMGKSQMLNAATQLAARSVYVGGNTASTTGLTVTLTKEEGGETGIEAGALVLADQGVACIDELDKCKNSEGLLEAMEQQQVSIAKAGVVASLPARCSVIAAANPKHGSYNLSKTVAENLNMARPILSRFDLVFILRDRADKEQDRLVSSNIMNLYRNKQQQRSHNPAMDVSGLHAAQLSSEFMSTSGNGANDAFQASAEPSQPQADPRIPLEKRLAWVSGFNEPLPAALVRDYIAYAREFCKPKLTVEAAKVLKDYYMDLRYPADGRHRRDTVPITTRQLEALIRLSQARAKACLREFVLKEDAMDVVDLLKKSVEQVHTDEFGMIDRTRVGAGGMSNRKMRKVFTQELYKLIGVGAECSLDDLRRVADRAQCSLSEFQTMVDDMRNTGILMKKPDGKYQVIS